MTEPSENEHRQHDDSGHVHFAEGDLGTIQGILFGAQAEEFERRIATLDDALTARLTTMATELRSDLGVSETRLRDSLDGAVARLSADLASEREARIELEQKYRDRVKVLTENLDEVRARLDDMSHQRQELATLLEQTARTLRFDDR